MEIVYHSTNIGKIIIRICCWLQFYLQQQKEFDFSDKYFCKENIGLLGF